MCDPYSGLLIHVLMHGVISLPDATSYNNQRRALCFIAVSSDAEHTGGGGHAESSDSSGPHVGGGGHAESSGPHVGGGGHAESSGPHVGGGGHAESSGPHVGGGGHTESLGPNVGGGGHAAYADSGEAGDEAAYHLR